MKAKHIISAVLVVILPFVLILGFGTLASFLKQTAYRTFNVYYAILGNITLLIPLIAYMFWLSFVIRPKNRKERILLICCSMTVAVYLLFSNLGYWIIPFDYSSNFASTTTLICGLANLFAAIYMLSRGKKYDEG